MRLPRSCSAGPATSTPACCWRPFHGLFEPAGAAPLGWQPVTADPLAPLMELPGVAEASDRARDALGRAHRHPANLRRWSVTAAEAALRSARASSVLDGGPVRLEDLAQAATDDPAAG